MWKHKNPEQSLEEMNLGLFQTTVNLEEKKKEAIVSILCAVLLVFVFPSGGHHKYNRLKKTFFSLFLNENII